MTSGFEGFLANIRKKRDYGSFAEITGPVLKHLVNMTSERLKQISVKFLRNRSDELVIVYLLSVANTSNTTTHTLQ